MRRIVVTEFVTLDGVMEDPGGAENFSRGGWAFQFDRGADGDQYKVDELLAADALLLGRRTFEGFAAAWPGQTGDFANKINAVKKIVVSSTLEDPAWSPTTVIRGDVARELGAMKDGPGGDILVAGSGHLVRTLLADGLVDELRLMVFPIVLGTGNRLFSDGTPEISLRLVEAGPVGPAGVMILTYTTSTSPPNGRRSTS
jgi:dihydrofolate reductase